jgi:hypothetical protein
VAAKAVGESTVRKAAIITAITTSRNKDLIYYASNGLLKYQSVMRSTIDMDYYKQLM